MSHKQDFVKGLADCAVFKLHLDKGIYLCAGFSASQGIGSFFWMDVSQKQKVDLLQYLQSVAGRSTIGKMTQLSLCAWSYILRKEA